MRHLCNREGLCFVPRLLSTEREVSGLQRRPRWREEQLQRQQKVKRGVREVASRGAESRFAGKQSLGAQRPFGRVAGLGCVWQVQPWRGGWWEAYVNGVQEFGQVCQVPKECWFRRGSQWVMFFLRNNCIALRRLWKLKYWNRWRLKFFLNYHQKKEVFHKF